MQATTQMIGWYVCVTKQGHTQHKNLVYQLNQFSQFTMVERLKKKSSAFQCFWLNQLTKTQFFVTLPHWCSTTVSLEINPFLHLGHRQAHSWVRSLLIKIPANFSGPESRFMFAVFTFKIKVLMVLKMTQWNYQLTKQIWLVCELKTVILFNRFWF